MSEKIQIFVPSSSKNSDGKFYKQYEVDSEIPLDSTVVRIAPPADLLFPYWDYSTGVWVEDKDSIIAKTKDDNEALKEENEEIKERITMNEQAMLDLIDMVMGG